jgi:hypothetical protein
VPDPCSGSLTNVELNDRFISNSELGKSQGLVRKADDDVLGLLYCSNRGQ